MSKTGEKYSTVQRVGHGVIGLGYAAAIAAGVYTVAQDHLDEKVPLGVENAQPSDDLSNAFDLMVQGGVVLGGIVLAGRGAHHLRTAVSTRERALHELAHTHDRRRIAGSLAFASIGAAAMTGTFIDMADNIATSQTDVTSAISTTLETASGSSEPLWVISNTPRPELANNATVNPAAVEEILETAAESGISVFPARYEWHSALRDPAVDAKIQVLATGLPQEVTGLPSADIDCDNLSVLAAKELGIEKGKTFYMEGLTVTVRDILDDSAGANLVPVIMNNEDFARCLNTNPEQPFNALLAQGEKEEIEQLIANSTGSTTSLNERIIAVPMAEFEANTLQTGKNNVNPFVLPAILLALGFAGNASLNRASDKLANSRKNNTMLYASGMSKKDIAKLHYERASAESVQSAVASLPLIVLLDYSINTGTPGASLGPSATTALAVIGATTAMNTLATRRALKKEFRKNMDTSKGYEL
jgi:hypothetical protein